MATQPKPAAPWGRYIEPLGRMTVEQFAQLPGADGWTYELLAGRVIVMPSPGDAHAKIQTRLVLRLGLYIETQQLGILTSTSCYNLPLPNQREDLLCPDLSYSRPEREAAMPLRGSYRVGAPDLVIEIASPNDTRPELAAKAAIYLEAGVALLWVVWPARRTIDVWRPASRSRPARVLTAADTLDGETIAPGFQCPVAAIFGE